MIALKIKILVSSVLLIMVPVTYAMIPVSISGPSPAIPSSLVAGTSNTYTYTITNNVPVALPFSINGLSDPVTRTAVSDDCGDTLGANSSCNIGVQIALSSGQTNHAFNETLSVNYQGRAPLTAAIDFTAVGNSNDFFAFGGSYYSSVNHALIIQSADTGSSWNASIDDNYTVFSNANCVGNIISGLCIAAGYSDSGAVLTQTTDAGDTWHVVDLMTLDIIRFNAVSCTDSASSGETCIAAGYNYTNYGPYLVQTVNGGQTWTVPTLIGTSNIDQLSSASCTGNGDGRVCIAAGMHVTDFVPTIMHSSMVNGELNWAMATTSGINPIDTVNAASCSGVGASAVCVVVGAKGSSPILIASTDAGATWANTNAVLPGIGVFNSASCNNNSGTCIAVGQYAASSLLIFNGVVGGNWSQITSIANLPDIEGNLASVNCAGSLCVAVGRDYTHNRPLLVESTDSGVSWAYQDLTGVLSQNGLLNSVNCAAIGALAICEAVGQDGNGHPMVVSSRDNGSTWASGVITNNPSSGSLYAAAVLLGS